MRNIMKQAAPLFVLALLALGTAQNAQAAGTLAGTQVDNQATMTYNVAAVPQNTVYSAGNSGVAGPLGGTLTRFLVDRKINLMVAKTDATIVTVAPAQTNAVLTFTVQNLGNSPQDFALTSIAQAGITDAALFGGITDNFDANNVRIFVESAGVPDGYTAGVDTATNIINLAPDATKTVYLVVDIPSTRIDKDIAIYTLKATAKEPNTAAATAVTETAGADTVLTMDTVFADVTAGSDDAARDAAYSARDAFKVVAPVLTLAKTSAVISDPVNLGVNPKAIPGAVVEYTVTITNSATSTGTATNVAISDSLATMVGSGYITYNAGTLNVTAPNINGGLNKALTDVVDGDVGSVVGNIISVTGITLAPGQTATIKFRVTITA
jgi:hypothetical protein